ncbi:ankyrin repeat domain-containing protein [Candidatus Babela massiliensis]|uniref:Ankyrin repeats containing protein n=1 Tax=Candidatus Babela massiliensis TaxID=673862 RepID=V6DF22_9BACT|nr:ankyrin repeat domain-containing protein [Candidatus Babela massiliensis]CDK30175.1 Ankyrin repeats containing protein [Candidatus Babela massiliensis]
MKIKILNLYILICILIGIFIPIASMEMELEGSLKRKREESQKRVNKKIKQVQDLPNLPIEIKLYIINLAIQNIVEANFHLDPLKGVNNFIGQIRLVNGEFNSLYNELINNAKKKAKDYFAKEYDKWDQNELNNRLNYLLTYYYQQTLIAKSLINMANSNIPIANIGYLLGLNWTYEEQMEALRHNSEGNFGPLIEIEIAKLVIAGANPNISLVLNNSTEIISPLALIAKTSMFTNLIKILVTYGANIDFQDENGETPLMHAARNGKKEIVNILISLKADVNILDNQGFTALTNTLVCNNNLDIANILISHGADVNIVKEGFPSTLIVVADSEDNLYNQVEFLLNHGANIDFQDVDGNTALIYAVQQNLEDIVRLLIAYNADPNLTNEEGLSAIDFALNNQNIINIIENIIQ